MRKIYEKYIEDMGTVWSEASVRSEAVRLNRLWDVIDGDAPKLWAALKDYGAYSRTTFWTRVTSFVDWAIENGHMQPPNPYAVFRKKNKRCFKGTYERRPPEMTFEQAYAGLMSFEDEEIRNKLLQLLMTGMRRTESYTLKDGYVIGKGGKRRRVYEAPTLGRMANDRRYSTMLRQLKRIGIKGPHKLRGIFLSELVRKGINPFELKKVAGWSSLGTAESYINASDDKIVDLVKTVQSKAAAADTIVQTMAVTAGTTLSKTEESVE